MTRTSDTPPRSASADWLRALERTAAITQDSTRTLAAAVEDRAALAPDSPALIGANETFTYADLAATIRRVARWARSAGLAPGDRVALMMTNAPAYAGIWLGLSRVGIVTALINTQLTGVSLAHCLRAAAPRHVIGGSRCLAALAGVTLDEGVRLWSWGGDEPGVPRLDEAVAGLDASLLADEAPVVTLRDPALLIYTSGTTGLPKAAHVSHHRVAMWSEWFAAITDARADDRLYDCLPMYHSVGGVVAIGAMLAAGGAVIVRDGFSASRFWPDVVESGATIFQYIGELCRYLVAAPANEAERAHRLRLACGNGLRADVWTAFAARFAVPRILEFYAATEGSFSLFNLEGKPGAIGRLPPFMAHRSPVALVRHDPDAARPARGADGFCLRCAIDEPGEAIGRLGAGGNGLSGRFEGYTSQADTDTKVLRDVFEPGDRWFRTGDMMARDGQGFFRFVDRLGDTFRWKGENVAAAEVEAALRRCPGVIEASVYGVAVPGTDGRAGMAAIVAGPEVTPAEIRAAAESLPRYARPVFLRFCRDLATTGTFRPKKADLMRAGYDTTLVADPLFVLQGDGYVPLEPGARRPHRRGRSRMASRRLTVSRQARPTPTRSLLGKVDARCGARECY